MKNNLQPPKERQKLGNEKGIKHEDIQKEVFDANFMFVQNNEKNQSLFALKSDTQKFDAGEINEVHLFIAYENSTKDGYLIQPSGKSVSRNQ
jgi:hypothetical protein